MSVNPHIALIITGSIAAIKSADLVNELKTLGISVSVIMTETAQQWIKKGDESLDGLNVLTTSEMNNTPQWADEILKNADVICVAPASADFIKQLTYGDTPLAEIIRDSGKPLIIAPAMNLMMWQHPATQRNVKQLIDQGIGFLGPVDGKMACGDVGYGRFMEPRYIASALLSLCREQPDEIFNVVHESLHAMPSLPQLDPDIARKPKKKILLAIGEGKDALASYPLIPCLYDRGFEVICAVSEKAAEQLPLEDLAKTTETPIFRYHFQHDPEGMEHIRLPESVDLVLFAPVSAAQIREMAEGGAPSFLGCIYLASKKPVLFLPTADRVLQPREEDIALLQQDGAVMLDVSKNLALISKERVVAIADALEDYIDSVANM